MQRATVALLLVALAIVVAAATPATAGTLAPCPPGLATGFFDTLSARQVPLVRGRSYAMSELFCYRAPVLAPNRSLVYYAGLAALSPSDVALGLHLTPGHVLQPGETSPGWIGWMTQNFAITGTCAPKIDDPSYDCNDAPWGAVTLTIPNDFPNSSVALAFVNVAGQWSEACPPPQWYEIPRTFCWDGAGVASVGGPGSFVWQVVSTEPIQCAPPTTEAAEGLQPLMETPSNYVCPAITVKQPNVPVPDPNSPDELPVSEEKWKCWMYWANGYAKDALYELFAAIKNNRLKEVLPDILDRIGKKIPKNMPQTVTKFLGPLLTLLQGPLEEDIRKNAPALVEVIFKNPGTYCQGRTDDNCRKYRQIDDSDVPFIVVPKSTKDKSSTFSAPVQKGDLTVLDPVIGPAFEYTAPLTGPQFASMVLPFIGDQVPSYQLETRRGNLWSAPVTVLPFTEYAFTDRVDAFRVSGIKSGTDWPPGTPFVVGLTFDRSGVFEGTVRAFSESVMATPMGVNGTMELDTQNDGVPDNWTVTTSGNDRADCLPGKAYAGACAFRFKGDINPSADVVKQVISHQGVVGDTVRVTLFARAANLGPSDAKLVLKIRNSATNQVEQIKWPVPGGTYPYWAIQFVHPVGSVGPELDVYDTVAVVIKMNGPTGSKLFIDNVSVAVDQ